MRRLMLVACCALLGGGCTLPGARSDPSTFFTLTPTEVLDASAGVPCNILGLGPVAIPRYLDRPQLVTRVGQNELRLADVARWAEPLRESIVRVLRQDLVAASAAQTVVLYPWAASASVELAVAVDILRFEPSGGGDAELVARWSVREVPHGRVLLVRESRIAEPAQESGPGARVAALSRALGALAREITAAVRDIGRRSEDAAQSGR